MTPETRDGPSGDLHERLADAYRRRGHDLFAFAYRLVDGPGAAEDVVHDAFARLLDGRCHIDARRGDLDVLLFWVVRNVAREYRRRESTARRLLERARREDETSTQVVAEDVLASLWMYVIDRDVPDPSTRDCPVWVGASNSVEDAFAMFRGRGATP